MRGSGESKRRVRSHPVGTVQPTCRFDPGLSLQNPPADEPSIGAGAEVPLLLKLIHIPGAGWGIREEKKGVNRFDRAGTVVSQENQT